MSRLDGAAAAGVREGLCVGGGEAGEYIRQCVYSAVREKSEANSEQRKNRINAPPQFPVAGREAGEPE